MKANSFVFSTNKGLEADTPFLRTKFSVSTPHRSKLIQFKPREVIVASIHERFITKIMETIETHIANPGLCVHILADENSISTVQLYRKLKKFTGRTPNELIREFRLARAASLLRQEAGYIAEIAYSVGFTNLSYFTKCFRTTYGSCPSKYKYSQAND
jgi:transcriptional regulator GlxA family with amidase domain